MLPPESATQAQMATDPRNSATSSRQRRGQEWRQVYQRSVKDVAMDLWEIEAAKAVAGGNGSKKKAPRYPDPRRKKK